MTDIGVIGALVDRPGWDEATLRADLFLGIPGIPCDTCSVGKLHTEGNGLSSRHVFHPQDRACITIARA